MSTMSSAWEQGGGHHHGKRRQLCGCLQVLRCREYACGGRGGAGTLRWWLASLPTCMPSWRRWLLLWLSCPSTTDCTHPNLIATADVQSVAEWNQGLRAPFTKAAERPRGLGTFQNRSSVVANSIKGEDWEGN
ncbi:hypothetical protein GWK47_025768 [Chionoecetes opilio]|uniref:Uncharacterized protein n=1 Tax=Chionoecetes opilio TaxID=41210 RepID=A0A8J8WFZ0_CHIOP|nr:hypothetical protein GWK47_025768 [Chionoecetes opilio]